MGNELDSVPFECTLLLLLVSEEIWWEKVLHLWVKDAEVTALALMRSKVSEFGLWLKEEIKTGRLDHTGQEVRQCR